MADGRREWKAEGESTSEVGDNEKVKSNSVSQALALWMSTTSHLPENGRMTKTPTKTLQLELSL